MPILKERNLEGTPIGDAIISYGTWGELGPILAMAILLSTRTGWQTMLVLGAFLTICLLCAMLPTKALKTAIACTVSLRKTRTRHRKRSCD